MAALEWGRRRALCRHFFALVQTFLNLRYSPKGAKRRNDGRVAMPSRREHRPAGLFPGVEAAGNMGGIYEPGFAGRRHRHRRTLAIGAEKYDATPRGDGGFAQRAAWLEA